MYQIAYIGRWETLPETAAAICDYDTSKLEVLLQGGLDLDDPIQLSEYIKLTPLEIAVFRNDVPMIHFLLGHGADPGLAEEQPLLLTAARCCGPEVVTLFAGQAAKLSPKQKERAFQEVRWGKRPENIPVLEQAGITVDKFGGEAFRAAVSDGQAELAKLLLEKGADMNAVNKFGKNALQLAEEGALAYQSSFDLTKTEVSKAPVNTFAQAYEKAVAALSPEHAPEFMEAMKKAVGRQSFVETEYVLQLITRSLISKNLFTEEQAGKFKEEITGAVAEKSQIIDVRGVAFEHTVDLLRKAAGK